MDLFRASLIVNYGPPLLPCSYVVLHFYPASKGYLEKFLPGLL